LTWDRGLEMAKHKSFTVATKVNVYFCDPQSPWQRGTNENTNGLLRQYFPRKTDLSGYSQADLDKIAMRLNQRPRKTLGFDTPASNFRDVALPRNQSNQYLDLISCSDTLPIPRNKQNHGFRRSLSETRAPSPQSSHSSLDRGMPHEFLLHLQGLCQLLPELHRSIWSPEVSLLR
jgi:hypothetical protein